MARGGVRVKRRIAIALGLVAAAAAAWWWLRGVTYTIALTQAELEAKLAERFPLHKTHLLLVGVTYSNPRVKLTDGSSEIGLGVDARLDATVNDKELRGSADLVTRLGYDAANGTFVLRDARVTKFAIAGLKAETAERVRGIANALAAEQVSGIVVYKLRPTDVKAALTRLVLQSVEVKDGVLWVRLGL